MAGNAAIPFFNWRQKSKELDKTDKHLISKENRAYYERMIAAWRDGVEEARQQHSAWDFETSVRGAEAPYPTVEGAAWFESLRPRLPKSLGITDDLSGIVCDAGFAAELHRQINSIERGWFPPPDAEQD
ncbi:hypothetical protein [Gordonia tangerina]|uniref:Uncharacterized protein n=1 Tax=Gordonia tangerina TaxID=2911060 RepID=A0ABS9DGQ0_9ACTN|nr:hypothetical protein [Gordonia tangerina]MCF3938389.1 hypothetical protein [Gordonia tangerina]